ncbi:DNA-binding transcriptional regulator [Paenibacillus marchantiophytorum]|uniref:DNA-binding transcriptional regulator n=1 Tax=Paenibacillus marchantiophytorum TaxID=1619310 RepID=A0ABQ1F7J3_9BACL|nr:YafY family protein [Paenibacillus marchantiophytorum]GGA01679.1 DNA-binding transcriptional regulator [Paenibacillus marchantiophytorum]
MNKTQRLIQLMMAVNERMQFTTKEMADEFGVSERTMHRYLQELSELGMPLYTEFGPHGGFRLLKKRMLPPILFSEQEAVAMFFAFQSLQFYGALPFSAESVTALNKFYHYLPSDTKARINALKDRVSFWTPSRTQSSPYLEQLLDAAIAEQPLLITYTSKDGDKQRVLQPIGIYSSNGFWYFPSYCFQKEAILLFRADRIRDLEQAGAEYLPKDFQHYTLGDWLKTGHEANKEAATLPLKVRFSPEGVRAYERSNGPDEHLERRKDGSGYLATQIHPSNLGYFSNYYLSLGKEAVVEEPPAMVQWIREQIQAMQIAYGTVSQ